MNVLAESPVYKQIHEEGRQEGRQEGLIEGVKLGLELRFGGGGMALFKRVEQCSNLSILARVREAIRTGRNLDEIEGMFLEV